MTEAEGMIIALMEGDVIPFVRFARGLSPEDLAKLKEGLELLDEGLELLDVIVFAEESHRDLDDFARRHGVDDEIWASYRTSQDEFTLEARLAQRQAVQKLEALNEDLSGGFW